MDNTNYSNLGNEIQHGYITALDFNFNAGVNCQCGCMATFLFSIFKQKIYLCEKCTANLGHACIDCLK